ncbi:MAG: CopG family transcriptional regulator [Candidatus Limnocylindria bacterium]
MLKTTVYLTERLKRRLADTARRRRLSEAQLIREGIERVVNEPIRRPTFPLFSSGDPTLAERVDEELARGFGRD